VPEQISNEDGRLARAFERRRLGWLDLGIWLMAVAVYFAAGSYLALASQVVVMIIFALSLDLALGYGGIETLGHAAFFGSGAYAAGLYALHVSGEPISGLAVGAVAAGVVGALSGIVILRGRGLTQVMLTLAVATMLLELASTAKSVTGGDDGLTGYTILPVLGIFSFDLYGRTSYLYGLAVLLLTYAVATVVVNSPFGLTIRGIRENPVRMRMLGVPVTARLVALYALSAAIAGLAGALSAQITGLVGVNTLAFALSGNVLIMLILGGTGRLYGAFLGAALFVVVSDRAAAVDPFNWLFVLGALLILIVRFAPDGLIGAFERSRVRRRDGGQRP
jgi:branched-chain amino acid transport system permease protein